MPSVVAEPACRECAGGSHSQASHDVAENVARIANHAQENSELIAEASRIAHTMNGTAQELNALVGRFVLPR